MVASWISTVLHIVILCGSEIYIGSSANRLLYTILPVILKHPTPCIKTFLVKLSRVVCLPEETLTNFSHPTSISLKFYLPIDSNDVSIRIYQQACTCACSVKSDSLQPTKLLCLWDFPSKNNGVCCHFLLQGTFLTQESNPCLLHWQADSLPLSQQGSPIMCSMKESEKWKC